MFDVSICNRALVLNGSNTITSPEDNQVEAVACVAIYSGVFNEVIADRSWSFAKKRVILLPEPPQEAYLPYSRYALPNDCIRLVQVTDDAEINPYVDRNDFYYMVEDSHVLAESTDQLHLMYMSNSVPTSRWSPHFKTAFVYRLAADLALTLSDNMRKSQMFMERYFYYLREGITVDSMQGKPAKIRTESQLTRTRW